MRKLAFFFLAGLILCSGAPVLAVTPGEQAPDFEGKTLDGREFKLSDYRGEPILLKIGTTWCPTCRQQSKVISGMHDLLVKNGVRFVDVFIDESAKSVSKYLKKGKYRQPDVVILDEGAAHRAYNVYVIPRLILIDKAFNVVQDGDKIKAADIEKMLEKAQKAD